MKTSKKVRQQWQYYLMLIPGIIVIFIFSYIPLGGIVIAFEKYNPGMGFRSPWVGWDNFIYLFKQPTFLRTIWNTLFIAVLKLICGIIVPVFFALLLNEVRSTRLKRIFQTLVYIPNFLSWVIVAGILTDILAGDGILNMILQGLGMQPIGFLNDPGVFPYTMVVSDIWKSFGFGTVVYLAALTSIDPQIYESAMLDGATRFQKIVRVTIPMIMPTIILMLILSLGGILDAGFDQIYNTYSPIVYQTGDIIDTYVYRLGFVNAQYSVGAAVGLFKSVISSLLVGLSYILADKLAGYRIF